MKEELPDAEVLLIKDVVQHLPNYMILQVIKKIQKYQYVIICSDIRQLEFWEAGKYTLDLIKQLMSPKRSIRYLVKEILRGPKHYWGNTNIDIKLGSWRCVDMNKKPFSIIHENYNVLYFKRYKGGGIRGLRKNILVLKQKENV
jgi:hypothetical protein